MKKLIVILLLFVVLIISNGCSGVNKTEYEMVLSENAILESSVNEITREKEELESKIKELNEEKQKLKADKLNLQLTLASTYDAYRYMMIFVTTEVYSNSLTKSEWETYITKKENPVPTYDEIKQMVND